MYEQGKGWAGNIYQGLDCLEFQIEAKEKHEMDIL